jgi:hypothetical protein
MAHAKKIINIGNQLLFAAAETLSRKPDTFSYYTCFLHVR